MLDLEHREFRALSTAQAQVLAALDVDVYQRRRRPAAVPGAPARPAATGPAAYPPTWDNPHSALARAVLRAAGYVDAAAWNASGETLPDLQDLRSDPQVKRALWLQIRRRLARR